MSNILFFVTLLFSIIISFPCLQQYQCNNVSTNYNFVTCESGLCRCLKEFGFSGDATIVKKCDCVSPYDVYYSNNKAYCIKFQDAVLYKNNLLQEQQQMNSIKLLYNSLVWPRPVNIMAAFYAGNETPESLLFDLNCVSRVDPAGEFEGRDFQTEYYYAKVFRYNSRVVQTVFKQLYSSGNKVYAKVDFLFNTSTGLTTYNLVNMTETGTFTFNDDGLISSYYVTILNLGAAIDNAFPNLPIMHQMLCNTILNVAGCNSTYDPLGYYTDMDDCLNYHNSIPWGSFNDIYLNGNNSKCHYDHADLAIGRPAVHCSHAGKTGGGVCIDRPYSSFYNTDY